ncbi:YhdH/YhfP family quinone oxidoreductase [Arcobacter porcinus]|uniref:YhdH/YhfP family quinone oxidoreductase n=1 Tax=Arcobacter porcinus TaxID=1935204 RepID=UPI00081ED499|nr:YhdH/YhfP family quinone oxidoreductase [Arcobacter porcinus]OCL84245.1 putative quinone oxidoreductase YhfP [Arcobacter porcinus]OCL84765.1 putative quinone oxidoreductase YhfP [Arcobacter porcinus]
MKAFVVEKDSKGNFISGIKEIDTPICEEDEVIIKASYSSLNYKDALSSTGNSGVTKVFPHITGIDVTGTIFQSNSKDFKVEDRVTVTGYDFGMNTNGGHCEYVKVPSKWLVRTPENLSDKEIMSYGTAGLTAALAIDELLNNGLSPNDGEVLVSGASGGVSSLAISILKKLGFTIVALSSKADKIDYLKNIGANEVILNEDFLKDKNRALLKERYSALIDSVGGDILSCSLKQLKYDGIATCFGLTYSSELNTNVFPFILRGVRLIGIDSVECSLDKKQKAWNNLATKYKIDNIDYITKEIGLNDIKDILKNMLDGKTKGRYLVKI